MIRSIYLLCSFVSFILATAGADVITKKLIGGIDLMDAWEGHIHYAFHEPFGLILNYLPFLAVAVTCIYALKRARSRNVNIIFSIGIISLIYFYYRGYQEYQEALLDERWTAAVMAIGFLPFFVGIPIVLAVLIFCLLATRLGRRNNGNIETCPKHPN